MTTNHILHWLETRLLRAKEQAPGIDLCVEALCSLYAVKPHEVALLSLEKYLGMDALRFLWPSNLSGLASGHVLLSSEQSMAAKTFRTGRGVVDNRFSRTPHTAIFEVLAFGDEAPRPIQKIICAPMKKKEGFRGVVQVSRKGLDEFSPIPDFSETDLDDLTRVATIISRHLQQGKPRSVTP